MALVELNSGIYYPAEYDQLVSGTNSVAASASTTKIHFVGRFCTKDRSSKNVQKIGFMFRNITKSGGSTIKVSLQNVDLVNGPPGRGDGTILASFTIANADSNFASNTWYPPGTLNTTVALNHGDPIAVVFEFATFGGSDTFQATMQNWSPSSANTPNLPGVTLQTGVTPSFLSQVSPPAVLFTCDDGTFASLILSPPMSITAWGSQIYNSTSGSNEFALDFSLPMTCKIIGAGAYMTPGGNFGFKLYSGTTVLATASVDVHSLRSSALAEWLWADFSSAQTLTGSTNYKLAITPSTSTNITMFYMDVAVAAHLQAHPGETNFCINSRGGGAWAGTTTTRRPIIALKLSAFGDGVAANPFSMRQGALIRPL